MKLAIVGGGQLARMMALAAVPMGIQCRILDPAHDACAASVAEFVQGEYNDPQALARLVEGCDALTFDFENVDSDRIAELSQQLTVFPNAKALRLSQDRWFEKQLFQNLAIPTGDFIVLHDHVATQLEQFGGPAIIKTRRFGYDGKGQWRYQGKVEQAQKIADQLGEQGAIAERWLDFDFEVSQVAVRNAKGEIAFYPLAKNDHKDGILHQSQAPYQDAHLQQQAHQHTRRLLEYLDYVGVLTVEYFVVDGELLANEMAPRVHNSGHWTIEGAVTSQFANHVRAGLGLPLGDTASYGVSLMLNGIGKLPPRDQVLSVPGAYYHDYGKKPRAGRKVGHITLWAEQESTLQDHHQQLTNQLTR